MSAPVVGFLPIASALAHSAFCVGSGMTASVKSAPLMDSASAMVFVRYADSSTAPSINAPVSAASSNDALERSAPVHSEMVRGGECVIRSLPGTLESRAGEIHLGHVRLRREWQNGSRQYLDIDEPAKTERLKNSLTSDWTPPTVWVDASGSGDSHAGATHRDTLSLSALKKEQPRSLESLKEAPMVCSLRTFFFLF